MKWTGLVQVALGALDTPGGRANPGQRVGTPLTDVIHRNLKVALANSAQNSTSDMQAITASPQLTKTTETEVQLNLICQIWKPWLIKLIEGL